MPRPNIQKLDETHYKINIPHSCMAIVNKNNNKVFLSLTPNVEKRLKDTGIDLSEAKYTVFDTHINYGGLTFIDTDLLIETGNNELIIKTKRNFLRIAGCIK